MGVNFTGPSKQMCIFWNSQSIFIITEWQMYTSMFDLMTAYSFFGGEMNTPWLKNKQTGPHF